MTDPSARPRAAAEAAASILCLEIACPSPPAPGRVRCAACDADTSRGPLYARPHRPLDGGNGKCEVCGREDYDGIHAETREAR